MKKEGKKDQKKGARTQNNTCNKVSTSARTR